MANDQTPIAQEHKDFFISYTGKDNQWAQWIAFELEAAGYHTLIQAWDIRPGSNFVAEMDEAARRTERTILVLSEAYLTSDFAFSEWATAFRDDPRGKQGKVLPVRIQPCRIEGLLGPIGYIDLVHLDEQKAREKLLAGVKRERAKPTSVPFPTAPAPSGLLVERPAFPGSLPPVWNIPYPHNPLFTGREQLLTQLASTLHAGQPTALSQPQAISGLGGIGKTQIALQYAYQHRQDYHAVLWVQADTRENFTSSYLSIAMLLNLLEKDMQESTRVITSVKNWLQRNASWLLILDNADDLMLAHGFLPPSFGGHVLLTTRAQVTGRFARRLEVDILPTELGALFLLHRAGLLAPDATLEQASERDRDLARTICQEQGGLPLALDQAGAYVEETQCNLSEYQQRYLARRARLLKRRGGLVADHPESVATTWSLAFEKVEQANPAAADLLRLCAFLAPDAIPEEIITKGAVHLGPLLESAALEPTDLDEAIAALRAYSLVRRDATEKTLSVHRLVQAVLKDDMDMSMQSGWALRTIQAINAAFPEVKFETWPQCERCLPHALICAETMKQENLTVLDAAFLLHRVGAYLIERERSQEAQSLLQQALAIEEQHLGPEDTNIASTLDRLACCFENQGKYVEAEPLYVQALAIYEQQLGAQHPDTAISLNNLAALYKNQGKYEQAEPLYQHALAIHEQQLGAQHPDTATSLNNLARLYHNQRKYADAEPLYQRALAIYKQRLGATHPFTATSLNNLASLYYDRGKYVEAEPLYKQALAMREQMLGFQHPDTAQSLNSLANFYYAQGKYAEAEPLLKRALPIMEQKVGAEHPDMSQSLNNLAVTYWKQRKYAEAEPLYVRALSIIEQQLGAEHPDTAITLNDLAAIYWDLGKYAEAEPLLKRALAICEQQLGPDHPHTTSSLNNLATFYQDQGKDEQVEPLYQRVVSTYEQQLGPKHLWTATSLNNLANLYQNQGKYSEAEPLFKRALAIREQQLGPSHPDTAITLNDLAAIYWDLGKYAEAEPLLKRGRKAEEGRTRKAQQASDRDFLLNTEPSSKYNQFQQYLSIHTFVEEFLDGCSDERASRSEVHSPDQSSGDIANIPFFPNFSYKASNSGVSQEETGQQGTKANMPGLINMAKREIYLKIVYYGTMFSGKTTNLHYIHAAVNPREVGDMVSIDNVTERTIFFDVLPLELGKVHDFQIRAQLYTVPGAVLYQQTRFSVLKGAGCVIFVADSQANKLQDNIEHWNELQEQLRRMNKDVANFPLVMQWNKRDLQDVLSVTVLEKYLNPYHVPSYEAVAVTGRGVIEALRAAIKIVLKRLAESA